MSHDFKLNSLFSFHLMGALSRWMLTLAPPPSPILFNCNHYYIQYDTQMPHFPTKPFNLLSIVGNHGNDSRMQRGLVEFLGSIFVPESRSRQAMPCWCNGTTAFSHTTLVYLSFFGLSVCDIRSISPLPSIIPIMWETSASSQIACAAQTGH